MLKIQAQPNSGWFVRDILQKKRERQVNLAIEALFKRHLNNEISLLEVFLHLKNISVYLEQGK